MSNDRKLLELAAKAAGVGYADKDGKFIPFVPDTWNPLTDDGDALRLAVKLKMTIDVDLWSDKVQIRAYSSPSMHHIDEVGEQLPATRRAIVRAAAEIGRMME